MKPVIALVGRPNVGKSTLFNRLTKTRDAIVADFAGLTRDRHYGNGKLGLHEYIVIDTGGFEPEATGGIYKEMAKQTRQAVAEADVVIFVVDARAGISAQDHDIAKYLRKLGKPVVLTANKSEGLPEGSQVAEFFELGLGEMLAVSASHGQGMRTLVDLALEPLKLPDPEEEGEAQDLSIIRLAVAGRPNVGKSTLINTLKGKRSAKTGDEAGVTKIEQRIVLQDAFYLFDTPGVLWPRIIVAKSGYNLAASGAIGKNAFDEEEVALELLDYLRQHYPEALAARFKLEDVGAQTDEQLLEAIGRKRGALVSGGKINLQKAAEIVIHEFRAATMGRMTLETPAEFAHWLLMGQQLDAERQVKKDAIELDRKVRFKKVPRPAKPE